MNINAMRIWLGTTLILAGVLLLPSIAASDPKLVEQRDQFIAAEKALRRGDLATYERLIPSLNDYPLLPYLQYARLRRYLSQATPEKVNRFIEQYPESHLAQRLRSRYLERLAKRNDWDAYIDNYVFTDNIEDNCRYNLALYHSDYQQIALNAAAKIWVNPKSLPKSCDPLFEYWFAAGGPSADTAWQRFELAINARQMHLAKYLLRFLPESDLALANRWRSLRRYPLSVLNKNIPLSQHPYHDRVRLYAAVQTARIAPDRLGEVWSKMVASRGIDSQLINQATANIALILARKHHPQARFWFEKLPRNEFDSVHHEWYLRALLRAQDWSAISAAIKHLPNTLKQDTQWRYWKARSLQQLGEEKESHAIYSEIAEHRSYYGFLAADKLNLDYQFNPELLKYTQTEIDQFEQLDAVKRIKELVALDRKTDARREWYYLLPHLNNESLKKFAALLHQWGWHDRAILTVARSDHRDDLELRFPLLHQDTVQKYAKQRKLDPMLMLAMIRQESAYNVEARSHAGARGLMQLMPATARNVAKSLGLKLKKKAQLYKPDFNIALGSSYIAQMLKRFDDNSILATAAYNAGPHRVKRWLPEDTQLPADIWVDTIPFNETRGYVKNIHAYIAVYNYRLGNNPVVISQQMKPVGPKLTAKVKQTGVMASSAIVVPVSN